VIPIPLNVFVPMHDFIKCDNSPLDRGAPFIVHETMKHFAYVDSIATVLDSGGNLVAWLYRANGKIYVQANGHITSADAAALKVRFVGVPPSGLAGPITSLPMDLHASPCSSMVPTSTPPP
jgi:hypothetical protein